MKKLILISLFAISATVYSQTELPKDSLPTLKKESLKFDERLDNYLKLDKPNNSLSNTSTHLYKPLVEDVPKLEVTAINLPPIDVYLGPPIENNTFTQYPFANDYSFHSRFAISNKSWLSTSSSQYGYPTLGAIRTVNLRFHYQPTDWLVISAGPYGSKYNIYRNSYNDVGANSSIKFILSDRIRINGYGQYSAYGGKNGVQGPMMGMYPQTYYGGTVEVKISNKFGIEGGIIRELNPFNGKWENRPYIAPVFYSK